ncbi:MAG: hypothetical protein H7203_10880 [Rhizobacter sp.]|nr:hypothetical protein [Burkholderiales bacterium]
MQQIIIAPEKRLFRFHWNAKLLAMADPYLVWADLTNARAIQSSKGDSKEVASVRLFVEKISAGRTTYSTENQPLSGLEQRLVKAADNFERVELSSPLRSPEAIFNLQAGNTKAPLGASKALTGDVLAVIDFGCAFAHNAFKALDSFRTAEAPAQTRVRYLWDQDPNRTVRPEMPDGATSQLNYLDLASKSPALQPEGLQAVLNTNFSASVISPRAWSDLEATISNQQVVSINRSAPSLAELPLSKYWLPPFVKLADTGSGGEINYGRELVPSKIDALFTDCKDATEAEIYEAAEYYDLSGNSSHGAHILSTATGWPNLCSPETDPAPAPDAASKVEIIFVQLPATTVADTSGNSLGGYVNDALEYILARTADDSRVVVNLSYGCYAGPHDGSSLIEKAMDAAIERGRERGARRGFDVVVAAGNSFQAGCHALLKLKKNIPQTLKWVIQPDNETWSFVEIWYRGSTSLKVSITPPFATESLGPAPMDSVLAFGEGDTPLCTIVHSGNASERYRKRNRMALIAVAPTRNRNDAQATACYGLWTIELASESATTVNVWIERDEPILAQTLERRQSVFVTNPQDDDCVDQDYSCTAVTKYQTLNGIATGVNTIAVGSTVKQTKRPARYSAAAAKRGGKSVEVTCDADEATVLAGSLAFGNYGSCTYRRSGTSVAAAMHSRNLLNTTAAAQGSALERRRTMDEARGVRVAAKRQAG